MSGLLLALDTSTPIGAVALGDGPRVRAEVAVGVSARQAESLLPSVDFALRSVGARPEDLAGIVVGAGPGSFTGVRIAAATAKGLVRALSVPLYAYSSLLAQAASVGEPDRPVCALFDARRGEVYGACYRFPDLAAVETLVAPTVGPLRDVLDAAAAASPAARAPGPGDGARLLCVGEGALRHAAGLREAGALPGPPQLAAPRAAALLWLAALDPAAGAVADPGGWEPEYLRAWGGERVA